MAFLDSNQNSARDEGEIPLSNIPFHILPASNAASHAFTNVAGEAQLFGAAGACNNGRIVAEPPPEFSLTTPATVPVSGDGRYEFGFVYAPGIPTRTPRPAAEMSCEFPIESIQADVVTDIRTDSVGHVWIATLGRLFEVVPVSGDWISYPGTGGFGLGVLADGRIAGGTDSIEIFDGKDWQSIWWAHGYIYGIVSAANGDLWILDRDGLSRLGANGKVIESYSAPQPVREDGSLTITSDQTLWITGLRDADVTALPLAGRSTGVWNFSRYYPSDLPFRSDNWLQNATAAMDGSIWFTTGSWLFEGSQAVNLDPSTNTWTVYDLETTNNALSVNSLTSIAVLADGSVWLAGEFDGLVRLVPGSSGLPEEAAVEIYLPEELQGRRMTAVGFESPGVIWAGGESIIARCEVRR